MLEEAFHKKNGQKLVWVNYSDFQDTSVKVSTPVLALFTAYFRKTYMLKKKIPIHTSDY